MRPLDMFLADAPILMEGAMGTMLMSAAGQPGALGDLLNLDQPNAVRAVHRQYAEAGARIHFTNTFNGNRVRMRAAGLADHCATVNRAGAELARLAATPGAFVAGSMGPTGELLSPIGTLAPQTAEIVYSEQAEALAAGGVDLFWIETMMSLVEAEAAIAGCRRIGDRPIAVSMSFSETPRGFFTMMGHSAADCVQRLDAAGVDIIGANCQLNSRQMVRLGRELKRSTSRPVALQPNAGQPELRDGLTHYSETAGQFGEAAVQLAALGVELIGGCCGTTPEYIATARARLSALRFRPSSPD